MNRYNRDPQYPIKKIAKIFNMICFIIFTYMIVVQLNFLTVLCARHIRNAQDEMGGINLTIMKVFIKDFFSFPLNYTLVPLKSFSKSAKNSNSNLILYNKTHKIKK